MSLVQLTNAFKVWLPFAPPSININKIVCLCCRKLVYNYIISGQIFDSLTLLYDLLNFQSSQSQHYNWNSVSGVVYRMPPCQYFPMQASRRCVATRIGSIWSGEMHHIWKLYHRLRDYQYHSRRSYSRNSCLYDKGFAAVYYEESGDYWSLFARWIVSDPNPIVPWSKVSETVHSVIISCIIRIAYLNSAQTSNPGTYSSPVF